MGATVEPRGSTSNTISPFLSLTLPLFSPHLLSSPAVYNSVAAKYLTPSVYFERSPWHGPTVFRKRRERMAEATKGLSGRATCVDDRRWNACWNCTCQEFVPTSARTRFVSSITCVCLFVVLPRPKSFLPANFHIDEMFVSYNTFVVLTYSCESEIQDDSLAKGLGRRSR